MSGVISVSHRRVVCMNLLIRNSDIFSLMATREKMRESKTRIGDHSAFRERKFSSRNLVVALRELSIRGDFHSTGQ